MILKAHEITGLYLSNEDLTKSEFSIIKKKYLNITLDKAILIFEKAPTHMTLEEFAESKNRTADGYRKVFKTFWKQNSPPKVRLGLPTLESPTNQLIPKN